MSKDTKYVICGGLAFTEDKDMKKLRDLAKEGWILENFKYLSYKLKKSQPEDVVYCVDYNDDKNDLDSYFEIFSDSDWKHVCSYDGFHFFKARTGTAPIYTDADTQTLKYQRMNIDVKKGTIYILIATIVAFILTFVMERIDINSNIYETIKLISYMITGSGVGMSIVLGICILLINKRSKIKDSK